MMAGHLNGSGRKPEDDDGKVASLADARKRAAEKAKQAKRAARGHMGPRDWIIGSIFVAMAAGMIWHWLSPLVGTTGGPR